MKRLAISLLLLSLLSFSHRVGATLWLHTKALAWVPDESGAGGSAVDQNGKSQTPSDDPNDVTNSDSVSQSSDGAGQPTGSDHCVGGHKPACFSVDQGQCKPSCRGLFTCPAPGATWVRPITGCQTF